MSESRCSNCGKPLPELTDEQSAALTIWVQRQYADGYDGSILALLSSEGTLVVLREDMDVSDASRIDPHGVQLL